MLLNAFKYSYVVVIPSLCIVLFRVKWIQGTRLHCRRTAKGMKRRKKEKEGVDGGGIAEGGQRGQS